MHERWVDDYIGKVTKDMGVGQGAEVGAELRSHIYDSSEAIAAKRGVAVDDAIVGEVLTKMLPPEKLAALYPSNGTFLKKSVFWKTSQALAGLAASFLLVAGIVYAVAPDAIRALPGAAFPAAAALALAIIALVALFFGVYLYESRLRLTYEARIRRLMKSLEYPASPFEAGIVIALALFGMAMVLLWPAIPFPMDLDTGRLVPLLSPDFAPFVPYFVLWLAGTIAVQVLYLVFRPKWVPSLIEAGLGLAGALMDIWLLQAFPFNPGLSAPVGFGIKALVALFIVGSLAEAAMKLWQTARFYVYGDLAYSPADEAGMPLYEGYRSA